MPINAAAVHQAELTDLFTLIQTVINAQIRMVKRCLYSNQTRYYSGGNNIIHLRMIVQPSAEAVLHGLFSMKTWIIYTVMT